jgi:hypothetical protein
VQLTDQLPDVRRPWFLGGEDSDRCSLEEDQLTCWFGTLAEGESATVLVKAYTDRIPCGRHLTNTAGVTADDDANEANNSSSAGIEARSC